MNNKEILGVVKKLASILLALCFMLPLSTCTGKKPDVGDQTDIHTSTLYGFDIARDGWKDIRAGKPDGLMTVLIVFHVFFVPIMCLGLKPRLQAVIYLFGSLAAEYFLMNWVFVFATRPEIGGVIAILCWALLFCIGSGTLLRSIIQRVIGTSTRQPGRLDRH
jgi:hypothetical protein